MVRTTRAQRVTLKWKWEAQNRNRAAAGWVALSYREFRRRVEPYFDSTGCIMVPWCGMWLGIERDGDAHT